MREAQRTAREDEANEEKDREFDRSRLLVRVQRLLVRRGGRLAEVNKPRRETR